MDVDIGLSAHANVRRYHELKKAASLKEEKTRQASTKALAAAEQKARSSLQKVREWISPAHCTVGGDEKSCGTYFELAKPFGFVLVFLLVHALVVLGLVLIFLYLYLCLYLFHFCSCFCCRSCLLELVVVLLVFCLVAVAAVVVLALVLILVHTRGVSSYLRVDDDKCI